MNECIAEMCSSGVTTSAVLKFLNHFKSFAGICFSKIFFLSIRKTIRTNNRYEYILDFS